MLTMWRIASVLLIVSWSLGSGVTQSQPPLPTPSIDSNHQKEHTAAGDEKPTYNPTGTDKYPFVIKSLEAEKTPERTEQDRPEREERAANEGRLVWWTIVLSIATAVLAVIAVGQLFAFSLQARRLRETVDEMKIATKATDKAAEASVVASMPVLSPKIFNGQGLHPLNSSRDIITEPITFTSRIRFVFENFGRTPALIREVKADLFVCEMDEFPVVDFKSLPIINYQPMIAGESRGDTALMGAAEYAKSMILTATEYRELLAETSSGKYRRFNFVGLVIYDDFFENRHTRRFCVELRRHEMGFSQLVRGRKTYNHVERQAIPKDE